MNDVYFASGVIACIENKLLSRARIDELRGAKSYPALRELLTGTEYADMDLNKTEQIFFSQLRSLAPDLYDFFAIRLEMHDARIAYRLLTGELEEEEAEDLFFVRENPGRLEAVGDFIEKDFPFERIDRYHFIDAYRKYEKIDVVREVLGVEADYFNTRIFLRTGKRDLEIMLPFGVIREGINFSNLEEKKEAEIERKLEAQRFYTVGYAPVFRYFYRKTKEIEEVREIITLKRAGL